MKKNRLAAGALALAVSITACGCGDQIYELTNEEEAFIVQYSAHVVSKYNKLQTEGIEDVTVLKALRELREKEAEERRRQEQEEEKQQEEKQQEKEQQEKEQQKEDQTGTNPDGTPQQEKPAVNYVSLNQALQLNGIDAVYRKYDITSTYHASASYMVRANSGNDLVVLYVNLKNKGSKAAECDILSKMPSFRLTINGELSVSADTTILLNDLGTYQGTIRAGNKAKTVLIFQVKHGAVKKVETMDLEVTIDGTSSQVQLAG